MPLYQKLIASIILEKCESIQERCPKYRETIMETICDILEYERIHRISSTNVQQKVSDKCNAAARYLAQNSKNKL